jgi:hypothetical protein
MFVKGFLFALGFEAGILLFSSALVAIGIAIEKFVLRSRKPQPTSTAVDISVWRKQVPTRSVRDNHRPAS